MAQQSRKRAGRPPRAFSTQTDLRRRAGGSRRERRSLLILCEGKTEKHYFTGMRTRTGPQLDVDAPDCDHVAIVREAKRRRADDYDEIWCVLDTELDDRLVGDILDEARGTDVRIAPSSPSFELWLILHLKDHRGPFQFAREAERTLKELRPGWSKSATRFEDFKEGLEPACARARKLHEGDGPPPNPSSAVWRLVKAIRGDADR
ncbi:RloB family protein [Actinomadura geliboluensis]|nr:RloB family protein [Actinomadura geliboluensis]